MGTKADALRARIARLEKMAGKGSCPICRLERRHSWVSADKPRPTPEDPSSVLVTRCEECGSPSRADLSGYPEELRELVRLSCTSTFEDTFTDPRVWAAEYWMAYKLGADEHRRKALREMRKLSESSHEQNDYARRQEMLERKRAREKDPDVKLYNELTAKVNALYVEQFRRLGQKYGERPFPEIDARLDAVEAPDYEHMYKGEPYEHDLGFSPMYEIKEEAKAWKGCAVLEEIVLGGASAHTAGKLADCERLAREVVDAAREKHRAREEKRRLDEAERERWRLERASASAPRA
jgi:hypothetical protein